MPKTVRRHPSRALAWTHKVGLAVAGIVVAALTAFAVGLTPLFGVVAAVVAAIAVPGAGVLIADQLARSRSASDRIANEESIAAREAGKTVEETRRAWSSPHAKKQPELEDCARDAERASRELEFQGKILSSRPIAEDLARVWTVAVAAVDLIDAGALADAPQRTPDVAIVFDRALAAAHDSIAKFLLGDSDATSDAFPPLETMRCMLAPLTRGDVKGWHGVLDACRGRPNPPGAVPL
jgi:hypothetical protein